MPVGVSSRLSVIPPETDRTPVVSGASVSPGLADTESAAEPHV